MTTLAHADAQEIRRAVRGRLSPVTPRWTNGIAPSLDAARLCELARLCPRVTPTIRALKHLNLLATGLPLTTAGVSVYGQICALGGRLPGEATFTALLVSGAEYEIAGETRDLASACGLLDVRMRERGYSLARPYAHASEIEHEIHTRMGLVIGP